MAVRMNFTKASLNSIIPPEKGKREYYLDIGGAQSLKGLGLTVTGSGGKSFFVVWYINGNSRRIGFGKFPDLSIENARRKGKKLLSEVAHGENPIQRKKVAETADVTLRQVFFNYIDTRKNLKPGTVFDYEKALNESFSDWLERPMINITKEMVRKRHTKRGKESPARANNAMRVLRALFNFANEMYEDEDGVTLFPTNPVITLSNTKAWHVVGRKKTYISREQLPDWFKAVLNLSSIYSYSNVDVVRDYLFFILFTGVRREEAARLKWRDVNLKENIFTLKDTKNREDVTLPMSDYLSGIMKRRKVGSSDEFVFPGSGSTGHIADVRKQILRIRESSGVVFTIHDLRRTFLTIAESLDISQYTLKRLVNHKTGEKADVTAGYIVVDMERLRKATQRVTDTILMIAGHMNGRVIEITDKVNRIK